MSEGGVAIFLPIVAVFMLFCTACQNMQRKDHLPVSTMARVLLDVHLAEAYSTLSKDSLHRHGEKNLDSLANYYKDVFHHYDITENQFNANIQWYKEHPEDFDSVYARMIADISKLDSMWKKPSTH
jgi:Domain of unknown function (DUF4296)